MRLRHRALQWTADGRGLYVRRRPPRHPRTEAEVVVHDLATGSERPWRVLVPPDPVGTSFQYLGDPIMTPDGASYAYTYGRANSDFYVVEGLR